MKDVRIGKELFDRVIYQVIASASNANTPLLIVQMRVLTLMEEQAHPAPESRAMEQLCDNCRQVYQQTDPSKRPPAMFELNDLSTVFSFEGDEAQYILDKIQEALPRLQGRVCRDLPAVIAALSTGAVDELGLAKVAQVQKEVSEKASVVKD